MLSESEAEEEEQNEHMEYDQWQNRYSHKRSLSADAPTVTQQEQADSMQRLSRDQRPCPQRGGVNLGGNTEVGISPATGKNTAFVGPKALAYIRREDTANPRSEVFTSSLTKSIHLDKGPYRRKHPEFLGIYNINTGNVVPHRALTKGQQEKNCQTGIFTLQGEKYIKFDAGHGIDHSLTITHKNSNSTQNPDNFTPQCLYYNQKIRNPLRQALTKKAHTYKEIAIYPQNPSMMTRKAGKQETSVAIPEGFIFMSYDTDGIMDKTYYFPNLIDYAALFTPTSPQETIYGFFCKQCALSKDSVQAIWGNENITDNRERREAAARSFRAGLRISSNYNGSPRPIWTDSAWAALTETAALHRIERASEYDKSVETMVSLACNQNSNDYGYTRYMPEHAKYWTQRAYDEIVRTNYPDEDVFHFLSSDEGLPQTLTVSMLPDILEKFEEKIRQTPKGHSFIKLIRYYQSRGNQLKATNLTQALSALIEENNMAKAHHIRDINELTTHIPNMNLLNFRISTPLSASNIQSLINALKQRALKEQTGPGYEHSLLFFEIFQIDHAALTLLLESLIEESEGERRSIFLDIRELGLKIHNLTEKDRALLEQPKYRQIKARLL